MKPLTLSRLVAGSVAVAAIGAVAPAPAALAAGHSSHAAAAATSAGAFVPLTPFRVLDTRHAIGTTTHKVAAHGTLAFTAAGGTAAPVPANVSAVVLNVTVTGTAQGGYLTAYADGTTRPVVSNLNFAKGQTVANLVTVPVGTNGKVTLYNGSTGTVDLLADVAGYYVTGTATEAGMFVPVAPNRILDTRNGIGAAKHVVGSTQTLPLTVGGAVGSGVPVGAKAVVLNVTATTPTKTGYVTVFPTGSPKPTASNVNYTVGRTVPNLVTVALGTSGQVSLYNGSSGTVNLIADVAGYYLAGTAAKQGAFVPVAPKRILDTRAHIGAPANDPVDPAFDVGLQTVNVGGIPLDNVGAVVANVTATTPTKGGYVTVSPTDPTRPTVSNLNFAAGQTIANLTIVPPGLCSKATFYNGSSGSTHLLADVAGYFLADDASNAPHFTKIVKSLGNNSLGDLGDGTTTDSKTPVNLVAGPHDTAQVDGAGLALTGDGGVWAWGPDELGRLYANKSGSTDEGYGNCSIPQKVTGMPTIVAVAGTPANGYALGLNGLVYSWGFNDVGQLGRGTVGVDDFEPAQVNFAGNPQFKAITAGFALKTDGTVWGWGDNSDGQLGTGVAGDSTITPTQVVGLSNVLAIGQGIAQYAIVDDGSHTAGTLKAWGSNFSSGLGNGTVGDNTAHPVPVNVKDVTGTGDLGGVAKVDGGIAVLSDDSVVTWGLNDRGQLGNGSTIGSFSTHPVTVTGITVDHTLPAQNIAAGGTGDVVLAADGKVYAWGAATANGGTTDSSTPAQILLTGDVDDTVLSIGAGFESSFAVITGPLVP